MNLLTDRRPVKQNLLGGASELIKAITRTRRTTLCSCCGFLIEVIVSVLLVHLLLIFFDSKAMTYCRIREVQFAKLSKSINKSIRQHLKHEIICKISELFDGKSHNHWKSGIRINPNSDFTGISSAKTLFISITETKRRAENSDV